MAKYLVLIFLMLCSNVEAKELDVTFHRQNTQVWCWAATIAMVGGYVTGHSAKDCEVLSAYDLMLNGSGSCCDFPERCLRTGGSQEIASILSNIYGISGYYHVRPLSFDQIKSEINNDHPFIAALRGGFSGHVVVVVGYENPNQVILLDPMSGQHKVQYSQLRNNFQLGNWTETFTVNSLDRAELIRDSREAENDDYDINGQWESLTSGKVRRIKMTSEGIRVKLSEDWYYYERIEEGQYVRENSKGRLITIVVLNEDKLMQIGSRGGQHIWVRY